MLWMLRQIFVPGLLAAAIGVPSSGAADELKSGSFKANGVKIAYFTQGQGEPVVLIHGIHSSTELNWQKPGIIEEIATRYQVISLDLPGHGESDKSDAESVYGQQMVDDVVLLMNHLKIEKAHLFGYSMGGMVALKFTSQHPNRVHSLLLGGMGWLNEGSPVQRFWGNVSGREDSQTPDACIRGIAELAVSEAELTAISVPVTIIIGSQDPVKRMYVRPLQSARPDWPFVEIPDAGHLSTLMKPQFRREFMGWLNQQSGL